MNSLSLIAAIGYNNELGIDNHLLWKIPEDLSFYKRMTMGKNIIRSICLIFFQREDANVVVRR